MGDCIPPGINSQKHSFRGAGSGSSEDRSKTATVQALYSSVFATVCVLTKQNHLLRYAELKMYADSEYNTTTTHHTERIISL